MTSRHFPSLIPPSLRERARIHRRLALATLRADRPVSFRLSRYWAHVGQARAFEALARPQKHSGARVRGGEQ